LAGYTVASIQALHAINTEVSLVRFPVNAEAPFDFSFDGKLKVYNRQDFNESELIKLAVDVQPDVILCSGWNDKAYLAVCKEWFGRIPVVLAMDNKWKGGPKQQLARLVAGFTIQKTFSHCWVPGSQQKEYALKLGFTESKVKTGFYTCDTPHFAAIYNGHRTGKENILPHNFIYAGRYYEFKGVKELWEAFVKFKSETTNDWNLICLGNGDIEPVQHESIRHLGFVQPDQLAEVMKGAGVFILPSRFEPWAVAVQEFAVAGFPVLLSREVGAADAFLEEGKNGFSFQANNVDSIVEAFKRTVALSDDQLNDMGRRSHELGMKNTPERWANTLLSFIN
jgi:glycosyltransferase involved in cell wall biosynthesis